jgi:hypothetical protein
MTSPRTSYTFREGLAMMAAKDCGIDPELAAEAGDGATAVLNAIRRARKARTPAQKAEHVRAAQDHLRSLSPRRHPELVSAIQAKLLALQGRGGDTEIAHVTSGEVVIPRTLQTPEVMRTLAAAAARAGIDPRRYTVGHRANSVNPRTGVGEFTCNWWEPGECFNPHIKNYLGRLPVPQGPEIFPVTGKRPSPPMIQISVDPKSFIGRGGYGSGTGEWGHGSGTGINDWPGVACTKELQDDTQKLIDRYNDLGRQIDVTVEEIRSIDFFIEYSDWDQDEKRAAKGQKLELTSQVMSLKNQRGKLYERLTASESPYLACLK